jgi:hypothetical protein
MCILEIKDLFTTWTSFVSLMLPKYNGLVNIRQLMLSWCWHEDLATMFHKIVTKTVDDAPFFESV